MLGLLSCAVLFIYDLCLKYTYSIFLYKITTVIHNQVDNCSVQ